MHHRICKILFLFLVLILAWHLNAGAAPPTRECAEKLRQEGRLQEWIDIWESAALRGMYDPNPANVLRLAKRSVSDVDTLTPLVICVEFSDNLHVYEIGTLDWLLFSWGFSVPTGSFRDYYLENSYGQHDPQGEVYDFWVMAPHSYAYYTDADYGMGAPPNAQTLVEHVVAAVDPYVDFSDYDNDGDLWVDGLMIVHAGPGAEESKNLGDIWSHRWAIGQQWRDDVRIQTYTMQPERHATGSLVDIGVFCHEWGHDMGILWEEYDRDASDYSYGLGDWSVMATGCHNGPSGHSGQKPAHHSAYCKYVLGWVEPINVVSNLLDVEILQAETSPVVYRLWASGSMGDEFFLVENRQKTSFDSYLPGSGLLIYHVDVSLGGSGNDFEWCPGDASFPHYKCALEQADGWFEIEGCYASPEMGDGSDPFPGSLNIRAFDDTTMPSSRDYNDNSTQVAVWNISDSDSAMYVNLDVTWSRPNLALESFFFDDTEGGDGDGIAEPEETVKLFFSLSNTWKHLMDAWVIASADTGGIDFSIDSVNLGNILTGNTVDNSGNPLMFSMAAGFPSKNVDFNLHICGDWGGYCTDRTQSVSVGPPEILLVDDDNHVDGDSNYAPEYQKALDQLGVIYETWDRAAKPKAVDLSIYPIVIWFTGNSRTGILSQQDVQDLMDYLDGGGNLFLTSQDAAQKLSTSGEQIDSILLSDYLHADYGSDCMRFFGTGVSPDPIGSDLYLRLSGLDAPDNQVSKDVLIPDAYASGVAKYADYFFVTTDSIAGIKYEGSFRVVFFGFGFEAIDSSGGMIYGQTLSTPSTVMGRILNWLRGYSDVAEEEEDLVVRPKTFQLHQNYPNPFNPFTTIRFMVFGSRFSDRHPARTTLKIYNIRGQLVKTLIDEEKPKGTYSVIWDGRDERGQEVSSGVYFYRLSSGEESEVKRMVLLK